MGTIVNTEDWERDGVGQELQFFATEAEVQNWLVKALPEDSTPFTLFGYDRVPKEPGYADEEFSCRPTQFTQCRLAGTIDRTQFWIVPSRVDISKLARPGASRDRVLALSGFVLLQHGSMIHGKCDASRVAIVDKVRNKCTGEVTVNMDGLAVFRALRRAIERDLVYSTIYEFPNGTEEEDTRLQRMTQGALEAHDRGLEFTVRPGRLLGQSSRP